MIGYTRGTEDIDIWVKDDIENRRNLGKAKKVFGYENFSWEEMQFVPRLTNFYIGNGIQLEILLNMKSLEGFSFDGCKLI